MKSRPQRKLSVIGGGIIGLMEVYFEFLESKKINETLRATVYEKNKTISETTTAHLVPSLTPDEILSVVPRGEDLSKKLKILFNEPGGIRVDDVPELKNSKPAIEFIKQVQEIGSDEKSHNHRTKVLLEMGKAGMELWKYIYDTADSQLQKIMRESNFNSCHEPNNNKDKLYNGYRIDLIYKVADAKKKAENMISEYKQLNYSQCKILSPNEVIDRDPFLSDFCSQNSTHGKNGEIIWKNDAIAVWRPGGCIDTQIFLPKFIAYLKEKLGQYINESGKVKDCFRIKFERYVSEVTYNDSKKDKINGLLFFGNSKIKHDKYPYSSSHYVFCPGENVGELNRLGFHEPAYARFAGASLMLNIPIPLQKLDAFKKLNHYMEVHQEGVVLAWQARFKDNKIFIGVAGTKAFYGDKKPDIQQAFAKNRNLLQLNMINEVLPECISLALGKNTKGQSLTDSDLTCLEQKNIAIRWVGSRAAAYDGFPTVGSLYNKEHTKIKNARTTTHLSSGGVSFSLISVKSSRKAEENEPDLLSTDILKLGRSDRTSTPRSRL